MGLAPPVRKKDIMDKENLDIESYQVWSTCEGFLPDDFETLQDAETCAEEYLDDCDNVDIEIIIYKMTPIETKSLRPIDDPYITTYL